MSTATPQDMAELEAVINNVNNYPWRLKTRDGQPGGLVELPSDTVSIVVGDLHSNLKHLQLILEQDNNYERMKKGERIMIIIGDTVHNDQMGKMKDMASSVEIFEYIIKLMAECPKGILYIRGNHDTFDERLVKSGILQGKEFRLALLAHRGKEYVEATTRFFEALPLFVIGNGFVITHAGPVRGGVTRDELIHIRDFPDKYRQLIWNRVHEFRGTPSQKEYDGKDITASLAKLELKDDTLFIVGHNPLWGTGEKTGVWMDVVEIKNHHIIYSGHGSLAPYFLIQNGTLETCFASSPQQEEQYEWTK